MHQAGAGTRGVRLGGGDGVRAAGGGRGGGREGERDGCWAVAYRKPAEASDWVHKRQVQLGTGPASMHAPRAARQSEMARRRRVGRAVVASRPAWPACDPCPCAGTHLARLLISIAAKHVIVMLSGQGTLQGGGHIGERHALLRLLLLLHSGLHRGLWAVGKRGGRGLGGRANLWQHTRGCWPTSRGRRAQGAGGAPPPSRQRLECTAQPARPHASPLPGGPGSAGSRRAGRLPGAGRRCRGRRRWPRALGPGAAC